MWMAEENNVMIPIIRPVVHWVKNFQRISFSLELEEARS